jgi:hypothetical protein
VPLLTKNPRLNLGCQADVDEVKNMKAPPAGVKLTMEAVCVMKEIPPVKVAAPDGKGKVDDFWDPAKKMMNDSKFLDSLVTFDKVRVLRRHEGVAAERARRRLVVWRQGKWWCCCIDGGAAAALVHADVCIADACVRTTSSPR